MTILLTQDLCRNFGGVRAIHNVNLSFAENEMRAIIGPNGAGKTTFFNVITGRMPPSSGKVIYQGRDITGKSPHEIVRLGVTRTFQKSSIFPGLSVFENVRIAVQTQSGGSRRIFSSRLSLSDVNLKTESIMGRLGPGKRSELPGSSGSCVAI
jgi:branched-chain amino acid transport system ATP-binding protein